MVFSIVTPSSNQSSYLLATMESVLSPDGSLHVIHWRECNATGQSRTCWKLERRVSESFLNASTAVDHLIKKARWPATKVLDRFYQFLR